MNIPAEEVVRARIDEAAAHFLAAHDHLLRVRASERAMCHKFGEMLQPLFPDWSVDCEFNRNGEAPKRIAWIPFTKDRSVFPDIIVHHRGVPENLVVIEAKCSDARDEEIREDIVKLEAYVAELNYVYSVLLTFTVGQAPNVTFQLKKG